MKPMPFYQPNILQQAYDWLCQRRKNYHFHSDVWHLHANWETEKEKILAALKNGTYQLEAVTKISTPGRIVHVWSAKDALVLKMVAIHRKAIATVNQCLNDLRFEKHPDKTSIGRADNGFDFLGYHFQTIAPPRPVATTESDSVPSDTENSSYCYTTDEVAALVLPSNVLSVVGIFDATDAAIIKNATSSEVIATVDAASTANNTTQQTYLPNAPLKKTVLLRVAQKTINQFFEKISQLYEQGASFERIGKYVRRWKQWVHSGIQYLHAERVTPRL